MEDGEMCNSYVFIVTSGSAIWHIDGRTSQHISKFINHSRLHPNVVLKLRYESKTMVYVEMHTKVELKIGDELSYNYGAGGLKSDFPWLYK